MAHLVIVRLTPTDYQSWREHHGQQLELMRASGAVSDRICRDATDPTKLIVVVEVDDIDRYMAAFASPEGQAAAARAPLSGPAEVTIAEVIEQPL